MVQWRFSCSMSTFLLSLQSLFATCVLFFLAIVFKAALFFELRLTPISKIAALPGFSASYFSGFFSWTHFHSTFRWKGLASSVHLMIVFFFICFFAVIICIHIGVLLLHSYLTCVHFILIIKISCTTKMYTLLF